MSGCPRRVIDDDLLDAMKAAAEEAARKGDRIAHLTQKHFKQLVENYRERVKNLRLNLQTDRPGIFQHELTMGNSPENMLTYRALTDGKLCLSDVLGRTRDEYKWN